jgi:hypothetical protein
MPPEVFQIGQMILMTLGGIVVALIGFIVRASLSKLEKVEILVTGHATSIEVMKQSGIGTRVADHEIRLKAVEGSLGDIRTDVKLVVQNLDHVRDLLEKRK